MKTGGLTIFWGHALISFALIAYSYGKCMTSPNFPVMSLENLASYIFCNFITIVQCGASMRDLLYFAIFSVLEQLVIKFCTFYALNLTKKHYVIKYEVIVNYTNTNHN